MITAQVFISGIASALGAYIINKLLFRGLGEKSIVLLVPLVEEISKSISAIVLGAYIPGVHLVFGLIEAIYDLFHGKTKKAAIFAAIISIISHGIFGIITYYIYVWTDGIILAILIVSVIHSIWNYFATR